jgi:hypothetical protein
MRNIDDAQLFLASVETKPILRTYVKTVHIESPDNHRYWDAEDFLDFIVTFCPYISGITFHPEYRDAYWGRIMLAGNQGQLRYLQNFQTPQDIPNTINYYNNTCLAFRNLLQILELRDQVHPTKEEKDLYTDQFNELSEKLKEFKDLKTLIVFCHSTEGIAWLDNIIDRCSKFEKLSAFLASHTYWHNLIINTTSQQLDNAQTSRHLKDLLMF